MTFPLQCDTIVCMGIQLRDYQEDAVKFALKVPKSIFCMRVGSGKTICAMFTMRALLKRKLTDKVIVGCTKTAVSVFKEDFEEKAGIKPNLIEDEEEFFKFLSSNEKLCLIKHSMFKKLGSNLTNIKRLNKIKAETKVRVTLVIDEAHKMQNPEGIEHEAFQRISNIFENIYLYTATPYSSCLSQFYGLIHLIYPKLWKNRKEFFDNYIDEVTIYDPRTHRVARKEKVRYKNLKEFRKKIEPFTYFYYPAIPLQHIEHTTKLSSEHLKEYDVLCQGLITDEMREKMEKNKKND